MGVAVWMGGSVFEMTEVVDNDFVKYYWGYDLPPGPLPPSSTKNILLPTKITKMLCRVGKLNYNVI